MPLHPLFLPAGIVFTIHQLLQKVWQVAVPLADHYLDPLLCMPILLGIWQLEQAYLYQRRITNIQIWILTALLSLLFEIGFPKFSVHFTADWKDVALYFIGAALFVIFRGREEHINASR